MRAAQYLYVCETFPIRVSGVIDGRTVTAVFSEIGAGVAPAPIGALDFELVETDGEHGVDIPRGELADEMTTARRMRQTVYLHLDDGVDWHEVFPFVPVDVDPDLLAPLMS